MKVALVVHSQSGHTAQLARVIAQQLRTQESIEVDIHLLRPSGKLKPGSRSVSLRALPDISGCDALLCGGPVWAFNASPVLRAFFSQLNEPLKGKKVAVFVTHGLPPFMAGAGRALRTLANDAQMQGAEVVERHALYWGFGPSNSTIEEAAQAIIHTLK